MPRFPVDAPKRKAIKVFELLVLRLVRERKHIAMVRENPDGTRTPLTMPNLPGSRAQLSERFACKQASHETTF
jgi:hypothetical protein